MACNTGNVLWFCILSILSAVFLFQQLVCFGRALKQLISVSGDCKLLHLDSLSVGSKPMVALSLAELPGNTGHLVLAMGGLDNKIHLYSGERRGKVFGITFINLTLKFTSDLWWLKTF